MSNAANFETAKIYFKSGLKERAKEYLVNVVQAVPEAEREVNNDVYLKALSMLARLHLETGDGERRAAEAIYKLLPEAYVHAASRAQLAVAIAEAAARSDNKMIRTVHEILQRTDAHDEKEQAGLDDATR